jgi:hypothetical protein
MSTMRASFLLVSLFLTSCGGSATTDTGTTPGATGGSSNGGGAGTGGSSSSTGGSAGSTGGTGGASGTTGQGAGGSSGQGGAGTGGQSTGGSTSQGAGGASTGGSTSQGVGGQATGGSTSQGVGGASTGGTSPEGQGGSSVIGGSGGAGGTSPGGSGGSSSTGPCPVNAPKAGDPCVGELVCTYGDNPVSDCRERFACVSGVYQDETTGGVCPEPGMGGCPAADPMDGAVCGMVGDPFLVCGYPDATVCACAVCVGGPACQMNKPPTWHCGGAPSNPACPSQLPNAGTACSSEGAECTYGLVCGGGGQATQCMNGAWSWVETPCPG